MTEAHDDAAPEPVVLVVDDLPANLRLMEAVLAPRGHRVVTASSGPEALDVLAGQDVDIVLLDILMPEMDGYEVCRRVRSDPRTAFLPVVMVTASGDQEKVSALAAGADDFLAKPIDQAELWPGWDRWCGSSATTTPSSGRPPSWPGGTGSWRTGSAPRSPSSSAWDGCDGSCPPRSQSPS